MTLSKSPERHTFQKEKFLERRAEDGRTPENDPDTKAMTEMYDSWNITKADKEADSAWQKNNMEYDMRTADWFLVKVRASESYAQNVYAAMCNNDFVKRDLWPILAEQYWSASWRSAGGIVADMRQAGDYIDWYCSGIGNQNDGYGLSADQSEHTMEYVPEGCITEEIRNDLHDLGWLVVPGGDWENFK